MIEYDMIIIGAGRALSLANKAAKKGKKVALIEKELLGGTCANRGCTPSKLFIGYAEVIRAIQQSDKHYIKSEIKDIDTQKIFEDTNNRISEINPNIEKSLHKNIKLFKTTAKFIADKIIQVGQNKITARDIIIATGTRPKAPEIKEAWTTDDLFPFKHKIPKSIAIVGAGFIACELVNFFDAIGVETKLLVRGDELLKNEDEDIKRVFKDEYQKLIDIDFNTQIEDLKYEDKKFKMNLVKKDGAKKDYECEALLYAIGREPNSDTLSLENTNINLDEKGYIKRDPFLQTSVEGVYVMGDADGKNMLQHMASKEALYLGELLIEEKKKPFHLGLVPHAVFSHPEIASVGLTEEQINEKEIEYVAVKSGWKVSTKAESMKLEYPIIKLIVEKETYKILGCHLIGPQASTAIHQVLQVIELKNDVRVLKELTYIHPALNEIFLKASVEVLKEIPKK